MATNRLTIKVIDGVFNSKTWIPRSGVNAVELVNRIFLDMFAGIANLEIENVVTHCQKGLTTPVWNVTAEGCLYNSLSFLTNSDATTLRSTVITQVNNITDLDSYSDVRVYCSRDDMTASGSFSYSADTDGLQVFAHDCVYFSQTYLEPTGANNVDDFLDDLNTEFDTITDFEYAGVLVTNVLGSTGSTLFAATTASEYLSKKYLNATELGDLRTAVQGKLDLVSNLTYGNVQALTGRTDAQNSDNY